MQIINARRQGSTRHKNYYVIYIRAFLRLGLVWPFFGGCYEIAITVDLRAFLHDDANPLSTTPSPFERTHTHASLHAEKFEAVHVTRTRAIYTCYQLDCCRRISFCLRKLIFAIFFCRN